jgi:cyclopropane fatty-acyl-phospholipid synthase-like methyltransferase
MHERGTSQTIRSNLQCWKEMQEADYFEKHPCYPGVNEFGGEGEVAMINNFHSLQPNLNVVVIGCGYGRETLKIAPLVQRVYGIDVSAKILDKAVSFLGARGINNFTPILAEAYKANIPNSIDVVFSIVVMQHLTRDLVLDYFVTLATKLVNNGTFVVQFLEHLDQYGQADADIKVYEPSVTWSVPQLVDLSRSANLNFVEVRTSLATPTALWHWVCLRKAA